MEAPLGGGTAQSIHKQAMNHVDQFYKWDKKAGERMMLCKKCNSEIQQTTLFVSVHDKRFEGCCGDGRVEQYPLPYCPECEGEPKNTSTCVHV